CFREKSQDIGFTKVSSPLAHSPLSSPAKLEYQLEGGKRKKQGERGIGNIGRERECWDGRGGSSDDENKEKEENEGDTWTRGRRIKAITMD
ncbi:MAG: hypothetical protein LQ346_002766, partial [Caloplaca aetnensis]